MSSDNCQMKPVAKLTLSDLRDHPVWEYVPDDGCDEERNETWVRPVAQAEYVGKKAYAQHVHARFTMANGKAHEGFMWVTTGEGEAVIAPGVMLALGMYLVLPTTSREVAAECGYDWCLEERDRLLILLGARELEVFPISYELLIPIDGEKAGRRGIIE